MLTNFFKKDRAFSYARLFFLIGSALMLVAVSFGVYVGLRIQTAQQHQQASQAFFQKHNVDILQYNNTRKQYIEAYGNPKTTVVSKERKMLVDTYLSEDGTKGITIHYKMESDEKDDAILVGYLITGDRILNSEEQLAFLKASKGKTLSDIQEKCGVAKAVSEYDDDVILMTYATKNEVVVIKVDKRTKIVI